MAQCSVNGAQRASVLAPGDANAADAALAAAYNAAVGFVEDSDAGAGAPYAAPAYDPCDPLGVLCGVAPYTADVACACSRAVTGQRVHFHVLSAHARSPTARVRVVHATRCDGYWRVPAMRNVSATVRATAQGGLVLCVPHTPPTAAAHTWWWIVDATVVRHNSFSTDAAPAPSTPPLPPPNADAAPLRTHRAAPSPGGSHTPPAHASTQRHAVQGTPPRHKAPAQRKSRWGPR
uniref:Uncharacterized protein n=1 Tax=viral metagenome TaxID=1070528 RepID=A0A6C0AT90_9ZZZZ